MRQNNAIYLLLPIALCIFIATAAIQAQTFFREERFPAPHRASTGKASLDYDNDGLIDLIASSPIELYHNDGGFVDRTSGDIDINDFFFGLAVGDIDNDGDMDLFQASVSAQHANRTAAIGYTERPDRGIPRVNIQNARGMAKAYQVKQVLQAIDQLEE